VNRLSVPLALEDFVPVLLSAIGFAYVVRLVWRLDATSGRWAAAGAVLIVAGGLSRASWKLIHALGGPDLEVLHGALYVLLALGFPFLALGIRSARRHATGHPERLQPWIPVSALAAALVATTVLASPLGGRLVPLIWLGTATVASAAVSLLLFRWARASGLPGVGWLFIASLAFTIILNGLARPAEQTEALQWVQQGLNTLNQALFLFASRRLSQGVDVRPVQQPAQAAAAD
jgi:hypothetical protein